MSERVDAAIIGSGFSGSILAWILVKQGLKVALIDSATHPRFAIGESSTPIADMMLRRIAQDYGLEELDSLSSWGRWQKRYPEIACGRKRGFSYYVHSRGQAFEETRRGDRSLLVAASASDELSDTHWYRSEIDPFFHAHAVQAGAVDLTGHAVVAHEASGQSGYRIHCRGEHERSVDANWVIDASGQAGVLAKLSGAADRAEELRTRTHSVYAHYRNVGDWTNDLQRRGIDTQGDPFDADDAAQHHLLERGWMWMLRFNNQITSVGLTASLSDPLDWSGYPSLDSLLQDAPCVAPQGGPCSTGRLQRLFDPVVDSHRIMLPTAAVTIDPLHSTGIAHALAGVHRLAGILCNADSEDHQKLVEQYRRSVLEETAMLDRMVSTAYATMDDFPRFTTACMVYFAGAIRCEERYQRGETPSHLWNADDSEFVAFVDWACQRLLDRGDQAFADKIRERLEPWNTAGLMDPEVANRYAYTATKK